MNTQQPDQVDERARRLKALNDTTLVALRQMLRMKLGRTVLAVVVRGTHNLSNIYTPGMSFDAVAFEAGRQQSARELIALMRSDRETSELFELALREYENEWCSTRSSGEDSAAGNGIGTNAAG